MYMSSPSITHVLDSGVVPATSQPPPPPLPITSFSHHFSSNFNHLTSPGFNNYFFEPASFQSLATTHFSHLSTTPQFSIPPAYSPYPTYPSPLPAPDQLTENLQAALMSSHPSLEFLESLLHEDDTTTLNCPDVGDLADLTMSSLSSIGDFPSSSEIFPTLESPPPPPKIESEDLLEQLTNEIFMAVPYSPAGADTSTPPIGTCTLLEDLLLRQPLKEGEEEEVKERVPYVPVPLPSSTLRGVPGSARVTYSKQCQDVKPVYNTRSKTTARYPSEEEDEVSSVTALQAPSRAINVSTYRRIEESNAASDEVDYTGYTVFDTRSVASLLPLPAQPARRCRECKEGKRAGDGGEGVNRGRVSVCSPPDERFLRVRTEAGEEITIISPRPRYKIMPTRSTRRIRTVEGRTCFKCQRHFRSSKLLATHIIKIHQHTMKIPPPPM